MGELAMLRQLIGQLQQFLQLYGSFPPHNTDSCFLYFHSHQHQQLPEEQTHQLH
ncbi:hypothetical protein CISIN_1g0122271mg, partial [Citrus sinensis]